jgi:RNA polymerase sigma factor (sigma-70 family)
MDPECSRWFAEEIEPLGPAVRAYLLHRFPSLPDVDDLVQESFIRVLRARETGAVREPRALLFTSARNLAVDAIRRRQVVQFDSLAESGDSSVMMGSDDVAENVSRRQEMDLLSEAIRALPTRCRQVMTLRTAYGLSQREIAGELRITENVVEKKLAEGVRRCTDYFARRGCRRP